MSDKGLHGLTCPRCGGMVPVPEGRVIVICPFCEQSSVVSGERGVRRLQVGLRVNREQAMETLKKFLKSNPAIAQDAASKAELNETILVHLPFWTAWGRAVAWGFGKVKVGSGKNSHYEPRERRVVGELSWNGVACDVGEFGVRQISLEGRPLQPGDAEQLHRSGMVFEPVGSEDEALEVAQRDFEQTVREKVKLDNIAQLFTRVLGRRFGLVYYPVWVLRYLHRGRSFQVVVDGFNGDVLYGKAPGNWLYRAAILVGGMAAGAVLAIDVPAIALSFSNDDSVGGFALVCFVAGFGVMYSAWKKFRYGEHYEYHRYKVKISSVLTSGGDTLDVKNIFREVEKLME